MTYRVKAMCTLQGRFEYLRGLVPIGSKTTVPDTLRDTRDWLPSQVEGELVPEVQDCLFSLLLSFCSAYPTLYSHSLIKGTLDNGSPRHRPLELWTFCRARTGENQVCSQRSHFDPHPWRQRTVLVKVNETQLKCLATPAPQHSRDQTLDQSEAAASGQVEIFKGLSLEQTHSQPGNQQEQL